MTLPFSSYKHMLPQGNGALICECTEQMNTQLTGKYYSIWMALYYIFYSVLFILVIGVFFASFFAV